MKTFRTQEVLDVIEVSRKTLKSWLAKGVAQPRRLPNGYRQFDEDDLRRLMEYKRGLQATTRYQIGVQR